MLLKKSEEEFSSVASLLKLVCEEISPDQIASQHRRAEFQRFRFRDPYMGKSTDSTQTNYVSHQHKRWLFFFLHLKIFLKSFISNEDNIIFAWTVLIMQRGTYQVINTQKMLGRSLSFSDSFNKDKKR